MIYYFSATGNSKWAAMRLADLTGDEACSIADITRGHEPQASIGAGDVLGIVYPIYMSDTPKYVTDFLRTLQIDERGGIPHLKTFVLSPIFQRVVCRDRKFHATGACTSCGKCARVCPLENISLAGGRPTWHGNCMHCMACIQNCPTRAIQYGKSTESKGRYVFPDPRYRV